MRRPDVGSFANFVLLMGVVQAAFDGDTCSQVHLGKTLICTCSKILYLCQAWPFLLHIEMKICRDTSYCRNNSIKTGDELSEALCIFNGKKIKTPTSFI